MGNSFIFLASTADTLSRGFFNFKRRVAKLNKKLKAIFKQSLAEQLINEGNRVVKVEPNNRNNKYLVFLFENDEKLKQDLDKIFE